MPENDGVVLRTLAGLKEHDPLPELVEGGYWAMKRVFDRGSVRMTDQVLGMIVCMAGYGKPTEKELRPPTLVDLWRQKKVAVNAPVECTFRDQPRTGKFFGITASGKVKVILDGDPQTEEREFEPDAVRLAA